MRMRSTGVTTFLVAVGLAATATLAGTVRARQQGPPAPEPMAGKTAGQYFKNIKVLNDVPADQLRPSMSYITVALGVRCDFCHNPRDFSSDEKHPKQTARSMMQMLFAIDKDNFHGRTTVTCYTCHQGHQRPTGVMTPAQLVQSGPAPSVAMPPAKPFQPPAGTPIPTLDQILAKYADALGGDAALAGLNSRVLEVERSGGRPGGPPITQQVYEAAPNKVLIVSRFGTREFRTGYNGTQVWQGTPRGGRVLSGMEALLPPREDPLNPVAAIQQYQGKRLVAMAQIGDEQAYVVMGRAPDGTPERLFFDAKTGFLVRRMWEYPTIFGPLLYQADYSDYRKQDGVAIPYQTTWWAGGFGWTDTVKSVETNVPVASAQFEPPPPAAAPGPGGSR